MYFTIIISLAIFFAILFAIILFRLKAKTFEIKAVDLAVAILPVIIYLLLTGNIPKLEIGDILKIETAFKEPVVEIASIDDVIEAEGILEIKVDDGEDPLALAAMFQQCKKYIVLHTSDIPKDEHAKSKQMFRIIQVIRASIVCGEFIGLIVLDDKDQYLGSFDRDFFLETLIPWSKLADYPAGQSLPQISNWMKSNSMFALALEFPEKRIESGEGFQVSVRQNQTIGEALGILLKSGKEFVAVVDNYGRFEGTVTRNALLDRLLLTLATHR
jgi:hypothetical protein